MNHNQLAYSAQRVEQTISLYDPHIENLCYGQLVPSNAKLRWVELDCPAAKVELKSTGSISWEWQFVWEGEHIWSWSRGVGMGAERSFTLSAHRKPDPSYPVAIYTPATKRKQATLQMLDYNLVRVDPAVSDKKGFEILSCLSLLSFLDHMFDPANAPLVAGTVSHTSSSSSVPIASTAPDPPQEQSTNWLRQPLVRGTVKANQKEEGSPLQAVTSPSVPSRSDRAGTPAQLSMNEVLVADAAPAALETYTRKSLQLLADRSNLYIALVGQSSAIVPLVVKLGADVKHKHYLATGEDLKTFIDDGGPSTKQDAKTARDYVPPSNVKLYISRLDELSQFLPLYRAKPPAPAKPVLRPPINLDPPATPPRPPQQHSSAWFGRARK